MRFLTSLGVGAADEKKGVNEGGETYTPWGYMPESGMSFFDFLHFSHTFLREKYDFFGIT